MKDPSAERGVLALICIAVVIGVVLGVFTSGGGNHPAPKPTRASNSVSQQLIQQAENAMLARTAIIATRP